MNPLDFQDTAVKLLAIGTPAEADIRSAISRSDYAVYHYVLLWWESNARFPDYKDRGHAKIQMALFSAGIPAASDFSITLKLLNAHRREADYELAIRFNLERGQTIFDRAHHAIAAFDGLDKIALSEGIEDYLRKTNQI